MKLFIISLRLYFYGFYCDTFLKICTKITEKNLNKKRPLNGKMLAFISNLSNNSLTKWQVREKRFISLWVEKYFSL